MKNWTKLHILQAIARYSGALYAISGSLVTATALSFSVVAAIYLAAALYVIHMIVWNEYDRAKFWAQHEADTAENRRRHEEWADAFDARAAQRDAEWNAHDYGRHARI